MYYILLIIVVLIISRFLVRKNYLFKDKIVSKRFFFYKTEYNFSNLTGMWILDGSQRSVLFLFDKEHIFVEINKDNISLIEEVKVMYFDGLMNETTRIIEEQGLKSKNGMEIKNNGIIYKNNETLKQYGWDEIKSIDIVDNKIKNLFGTKNKTKNVDVSELEGIFQKSVKLTFSDDENIQFNNISFEKRNGVLKYIKEHEDINH